MDEGDFVADPGRYPAVRTPIPQTSAAGNRRMTPKRPKITDD
jgi:hypothetical protein